MNQQNVEKAIDVMKRVRDRGDRLDMGCWQIESPCQEHILAEELSLHTCGTAACFAGWVAVSPEWQAAGGRVALTTGAPIMDDESSDEAIGEWLGIDEAEAEALCAATKESRVIGLYGCPVDDITVNDVLEALYRLRDTGTIYHLDTIS